MPQKRSMRNKPAEMSRVDDLLGLLGDLSQRDPSPAVRARLSDLCSQRLQQKHVFRATQPRTFSWLRAAFAAVLLAALGLAAAWVVHLRPPQVMRAGNEPNGTSLPISSGEEAHVPPTKPSPTPPSPLSRRSRPKLPPAPSDKEMIITLPYSNRSVETGTNATIQVSMSQSELLSLGFPLNATLDDRRVVAELTLGDDGLPRAISIPLPLQLIKEEK
jgi:anti-sigma factor RsiW